MSGEKTEKPTTKRRKEARRKGNIPKSPEITAWTGLLVATFAIRATTAMAAHRVMALWGQVGDDMAHPDEGTARHLLGQGLATAGLAALPLALVLMGVGVVGNLAQTGGGITTQGIKPSFSKINPKSAIKRIFSAQGAWETIKSLLKVSVIGVLGWRVIHGLITSIVAQGHVPAVAVAARTVDAALGFARDAAAAGLLIAALDYVLSRRRIGKGLRMSKHEIKEEGKQSEGNPEMKGHIRSMQRKASRARMIEAIPRADAVIVNPTHVAVAISYATGSRAPKVVARGAGEAAARIREAAAQHGVPLVRDVPLARTLFRVCDVGDEVPPQLFEATARVLAFVYGLKRAGRLRRLDGAPHEVPA